VLAVNDLIVGARKVKLTRSQYVMFLLADMMTWCEVAKGLCHKAAVFQGSRGRTPEFMQASARLFARQVIEKVRTNALKVVYGCGSTLEDLVDTVGGLDAEAAVKDTLGDMDRIAQELVS
jgi:hypothetical protein